MKEVRKSARSVKKAIELALETLGVSREEVKVNVISEGNPDSPEDEQATVEVSLLDDSREQAETKPQGESDETVREMLKELLSRLDIDATVEVRSGTYVMPDEEASTSTVYDIIGDDLGILIGRRGQTLVALQYLVRLMVANRTKYFVPVILDVNGYRQRRLKSLRSLAMRTAEQVVERKMPFSLEPMPAFDRRIIHMILADHPDVTTQSVGLGEERKVVIVLKE